MLPLMIHDDEIAAMIVAPGRMKSKDLALRETLKGRLPKSYNLFLDTIYDIEATVVGLKDELGARREAFHKGLRTDMEQVGFFSL